MSNSVLFLLSEEAGMITGESIRVSALIYQSAGECSDIYVHCGRSLSVMWQMLES